MSSSRPGKFSIFSQTCILIITLFATGHDCLAQPFRANTVNSLDDRSLQLLGKRDAAISYSIRRYDANLSLSDTSHHTGTFRIFSKAGNYLELLPVTILQQYNSHHPYGWNDGAMIPAKGYQALISPGIAGKYGPLEIQLQPEFVFATNDNYENSASYGSHAASTYQKLFVGQSRISLTKWDIALGISSENLWWGPGVRNSLLMSNNAPGMPHVFFNSRKPIKTGIGSFEWELIGAWITSDSTQAFENAHLKTKKPEDIRNTRYLNGFVVSYQPKWVPGLFLGFTRAIQTYASVDLGAPSNFFEKYFPVFALAVQKKDTRNEDSLSRDQLASFFLRWMFPKANLEVYFEYGFNDYGANTRDYLMSPTHSAAHIAGIRKIIPRSETKRVEIGVEMTQMSQSPDWLVRNAGNWYEHGQLKEGYTYQNQIIGAGAGFGCNLLSIDATWINGDKRLGFLFERADRDPQTHASKWIDLGLGVMPQWKYKQFLISGLIEVIKTRNYMWELSNTRFNVHTQLSLQYHFN